MTYDEALAYMSGLRNFGVKLGNERFDVLLARLGDPHRSLRAVHVAGTKGKGSTTAMAAGILTAHGYRVGGYYSPYVYDVRERIQVDGEMISRTDLARHVTSIRPHIDALKETPFGQTTEFELKTAVGFRHFAESEVDFAAVEVGLGGRLDATNVLTPLVSVITNIGLDHTHILGETHAKIAAEKAGIIKPGVPVVTAADEPDAARVIAERATERGARLIRVSGPSSNLATDVRVRPDGDGFAVRTPSGEYTGLHLDMVGRYQEINAACAIAAVECVAHAAGFLIDPDAVRRGLRSVSLPGRMQIVRRQPTVIVDGAHNALAATVVDGEIRRIPHRRLFLVVGMVEGHSPDDVVGVLAPLASRVYATQPLTRRATPATRIADAALAHCPDVEIVTPPEAAALAALRDAGPDDLVLVTGSFCTVGDVRPETLVRATTAVDAAV